MKVEMRRLSVNDFDLLHNGCSEFPAGRMLDSLGITIGLRVEITRRNTELEAAARKLALVANGLLSNSAFLHDWPCSAKRMQEQTENIISALPAEPAPPALESVECRPGVAKIFRDLIAEIGGGK